MPSANSIDSVLKRGTEDGINSLTPSQRKVWLISEAEVFCDMEGIDSFLDRYEILLPEAADALADAGATQIAERLRTIHAQLPKRAGDLLDHGNALVTARTGYDYDSVSQLQPNST